MLDYKEKKPMEDIKEQEAEHPKTQAARTPPASKPQASGTQEVSIQRKISEAQAKKYSLST